MISALLHYLKQNDYVPKDYDEEVNIFIGHNDIFHFFLDEGRSLAVKVASRGSDCALSLKAEAQALKENEPNYGEIMPQLLAFDHDDDFTFLIMEGLTLTKVNLQDIFLTSENSAGLMQRFLTGNDRIINAKQGQVNSFYDILQEAIENLPEYLCQQYQNIKKKRKWQEFLKDMPVIPQHGDLGLCNIGQTNEGLVVFDWEDFAIINIPGFDLSVLLIDGCNYDKSNLERLADDIYGQNNKDRHFLSVVLMGLKIDQYHFFDLIMINIIIFYSLKCQLGYGSEIIDLCEAILRDLAMDIKGSGY